MGRFLRRLHHALHRERLERELDEEMAAHREMMPPERRGAFGEPPRLQDASRDVWGWLWLDHVRQDLIYAARGLRRDRRFAAPALGAIVLAVGVATSVFSVADRSLFRPLPYRAGNRLVSVGLIMPIFGPGEYMFMGAYRDWRTSQNALDLTSWGGVSACDLSGEAPQRLQCAHAEASFLPTLGVRPLLGRNFTADEDERGAEPVALISYGMWRRSFATDADIVERKIILDGVVTRIIGVLPADFETPDLAPADLLVPQKPPPGPNNRNYPLSVIGRLRAGQTPASAAAELAGPLERFRQDFGSRNHLELMAKAMWLHVEPLRDRQNRQYRLALWALLGAVAAFLLIACANVANLLLARSAGRRHEFAIRAALGGSQRRLGGQLLTESGLLGLIGGGTGCGLAWVLLRAFVALAPEGTLRMREAALDARVLAFALLLSAVTALVFGFAPSLDRLRGEAHGGRYATGLRRGCLRPALISGQLAVSLVLLAGAGLLLTSLWGLENAPLGLNRERVVTASFTLPTYRYADEAHQTAFFNQLAARLNEIPGALATAIADSLPPGAGTRTAPYWQLANRGEAVTDPGMSGGVKWRYVSPGYFEALGIPIRRGRSFSEADQSPGRRNAVVSESLAKRLVGDADPIGARLGESTIIGVAGDVRNAGLDRAAEPEFYWVRKATRDGIAGSGDPVWWRRATAIVRSNLDEHDTEQLLRATIRQIDPAVPVQTETMATHVDAFLARPRFQTGLLVLFAATGLLLAGIGMYGLVSFLVAERTREIGVRMALGATRGAVGRMVVSEGARWTGAGTILGATAAAVLLRLIQGLLYEVRVFDLRVFAGAMAILAAVALFAAWLPAYRASRIDPMAALRHE
jgi:predicted permease